MDMLLRKAPRSKSLDIEDKMDAAVTVFRFIKDKDIYLKVSVNAPKLNAKFILPVLSTSIF